MANVNALLDEHVALRYECLDRIFLNGYVPNLQKPEGLARFLRRQPGEEIPRYAILGERTAAFNREVERLAEAGTIPLVHVERGQRKEAVAQPYLDAAAAAGREGVVLIGIARERANVFRAPAKRTREPGRYAAGRASAYVNHVYFYLWDHEWGGAFLKVCTYAPWSLRGDQPPPARAQARRPALHPRRRDVRGARDANRAGRRPGTRASVRRPPGRRPIRCPGRLPLGGRADPERPLRELVKHHLGSPYGPRQMAYDLRRLVRKGLLKRLPHSFRYRLTSLGRRLILFCAELYNRLLCRGLAELDPGQLPRPLGTAWCRYDQELERLIADARLSP